MGRARRRKWQKRFDWPWERYMLLKRAAPYIVWMMGHRMREAQRMFATALSSKLYEDGQNG